MKFCKFKIDTSRVHTEIVNEAKYLTEFPKILASTTDCDKLNLTKNTQLLSAGPETLSPTKHDIATKRPVACPGLTFLPTDCDKPYLTKNMEQLSTTPGMLPFTNCDKDNVTRRLVECPEESPS